jgi:hypothetical protein
MIGNTMKTMTCKQLGGACDIMFQGETFREISELSLRHNIEMQQEGDEAHIKAIKIMKAVMQNGVTMKQWFEEKQEEFDALDED